MAMAAWDGMKIRGSKPAPTSAKPNAMRFSDSLTAALGNRKNKYKDVSKDLNSLINREEQDSAICVPSYNVRKIKSMMARVIKQQFVIRNEDGDILPWVYDASKNGELAQSIAKAVKDRLRNLNLSRYRVVTFCSIVEKEQQGLCYKMKYILDPYLDNYVQYVHDGALFCIVTTAFLVHKD